MFEQIKSIIATKLSIDESIITLDSNLAEDLASDSLELVELIMTFEEELDIVVSDEDLENIKTVRDIVEYIEANA